MSQEQKRKSPRIDMRVAVRVEEKSRLQEFYSHNLSSGGIFVEVEGKVPAIGSKLNISFEIPGLGKTFEVEAMVAHHHTFEALDEKMNKTVKKMGIGLKFLKLSQEDQNFLTKYITGKDVRVSA